MTGAPLPTTDEALGHACRLLHNAEMQTDRDLMGLQTELADSWVSVAELLHERGS